MTVFPDFDLGQTALECGPMLLEASAGTGKTYAITGIAARLIAVHAIPIRELLIVTFTEAATQELRDRVRRRLGQVQEALAKGKTDDPVVRAIVQSGTSIAEAQRRLSIAVASFDEASISTIHGFCQRVLRDHAFESGAPFEAEVVANPRALLLELAMDFWRKHLVRESPLTAALIESNQCMPSELAQLLNRLGRHPDLCLIPHPEISWEAAQANIETTFRGCLDMWSAERESLFGLLRDSPGISRNQEKGLPLAQLEEFARNLDRVVSGELPGIQTVSALQKFTTGSIESMRLKKNPPPQHTFFLRCSEFDQAIDVWVAALRHHWLKFAASEFRRMKDSRGVMTFDDMLLRVRDALRGAHGERLAELTRLRYRAALIDEFQDTDPLQYEIFSRVFDGPGHRLMFIGDPKQSIYGFRGADLFTYLSAKATVHRRGGDRIFTLRENHRSEAALVEAVNALFQKVPGCFLHDGVDFFPSKSCSEAARSSPFSGPEGCSPLPLQCVQLKSSPGSSSVNAGEMTARVCDDVVGEIRRLVRGDFHIGNRRVGPGDIAVLVRSHHQAREIQNRLQQIPIPSVRRTEESVFQTREADELMSVLNAILEPTRERGLKAALATRLFGLQAEQLFQLQLDEAAWNFRIDQFTGLKTVWEEHGFMSAFRHLLVEENLRPRLVGLPAGERILTNLLHLSELMHEAERSDRLSPVGLMQWMQHQREELTVSPESHFLRLERDSAAVQIITLHYSKGLQYGIVFCPFHWGKAKAPETLFHDPQNEQRLTLDLSKTPSTDHVLQAVREVLAEEVRLLYVGVTRAVHRCYLYACEGLDLNQSPLGAVLGMAGNGDTTMVSLTSVLEELVSENPDRIGMRDLGVEEEGDAVLSEPNQEMAVLHCRTMDRMIQRDGMLTSFSGLTASLSGEVPDYDEEEFLEPARSVVIPEDGPSIFTLPRGSEIGTVLHSILEKADFTDPVGLDRLVGEQFQLQGIDSTFAPVVSAQLRTLLEHPLKARDHVVRLSEVGRGDRLNEVQFFYPIQRFEASDLAAAYQALGLPQLPERMGRLKFNPIDGYLLGFIDLIFRHHDRFYIVDWKSNWLGNTSSDYSPERLQSAMMEKSYHLQSHLYAVALDLHLRERIPDYQFEQHFGGVFYLFLRGIDPAVPERGVHFQAMDPVFLDQLKERLLPKTTLLP